MIYHCYQVCIYILVRYYTFCLCNCKHIFDSFTLIIKLIYFIPMTLVSYYIHPLPNEARWIDWITTGQHPLTVLLLFFPVCASSALVWKPMYIHCIPAYWASSHPQQVYIARLISSSWQDVIGPDRRWQDMGHSEEVDKICATQKLTRYESLLTWQDMGHPEQDKVWHGVSVTWPEYDISLPRLKI